MRVRVSVRGVASFYSGIRNFSTRFAGVALHIATQHENPFHLPQTAISLRLIYDLGSASHRTRFIIVRHSLPNIELYSGLQKPHPVLFIGEQHLRLGWDFFIFVFRPTFPQIWSRRTIFSSAVPNHLTESWNIWCVRANVIWTVDTISAPFVFRHM